MTFIFPTWVHPGGDFAIGASWPGDSNVADLGWGQWTWVDGTNASNLNCNATGCNLWGGYVSGG